MTQEFLKFPRGSRALVAISNRGRELVNRLPEPVQLGIQRASRRSAVIILEVFAGFLVLGAVLLALAYGRINQGPISLSFLVPTLESAINRELAEVSVKIDDAVVQRDPDGVGVLFRLRNIRLIDKEGAVVAQAPLAAIGLSGPALLWGKIAPGSVDFIGPRLLLFYTPENGLSLTFSRSAAAGGADGPADASHGPQDRVPAPPQQAQPAPAQTEQGTDPSVEPGIALFAPSKQLDITRTLTAAFQRARNQEGASSYLSRFGVRDAIVIFDQNGQQSYWQVPDFAIDLDHKEKRSIILGEAKIKSLTGPWKFSFRTEESEKQQRLTFTATIEDLIPIGLAGNFPGLPMLKALDLPVSAETSVHLSSSGELLGAEARLRMQAGYLVAPWDFKHPMLIDSGDIHVRYIAKEDRVEIKPSTLKWGKSHATFSGDFRPVTGADGAKVWSYEIKATDAVLAAEEFGLEAIGVDRWEATGTITPATGRLEISRFVIASGENAIELAGSVVDAPGSPEVQLNGLISAMPIDMLKQFWPKVLAGGAREWVGERVGGGHIVGGKLALSLPAGALADLDNVPEIPDEAMSLDVGMRDLAVTYIVGMPPVQAQDARLRIVGRHFSLDTPTAFVALPTGNRINLSGGSFRIDDLRPDPQHGVIRFKTVGTAGAALELLDSDPLNYVREVGVKPSDFGGQMSGDFQIGLPLLKDLRFKDIQIKGIAEVDNASATGAFADAGIEGGSIIFHVTERALDARGDVLVSGVPALLTWQRIFGAPPEKQPEMRLTTVLDAQSRKQLGLSVGHMVRGPVPVVLSIAAGSDGKRQIRVQADLGNAELILGDVGWRKEPGRAAVLRFDVGEGTTGRRELQNFKIMGDDIVIDGWIALGQDRKAMAFYFPDFSFNVVTHMEIAGRLRDDNVWEVQAQGSGYDGRQMFQSLFSAGQLAEDQPMQADAPGVDLTAKIGAVVGHFDTSIKDVSITLKKRGGGLVALEATGSLNGSSPIAARLVSNEQNARIILAETDDAGAAFRLVGFYPRVEGGQGSLQVNLDGEGGAEKTGILWAKDFSLLGDRVVSEVLSSPRDDPSARFGDGLRAEPGGQRRQRIPFDQLRVP
ncbi:MAG: hypothetical protein VX871_03130, partial [Pseudomonadota bacterium]|nr:hypothetical protein [Pseudomonadota bacterium]